MVVDYKRPSGLFLLHSSYFCAPTLNYLYIRGLPDAARCLLLC